MGHGPWRSLEDVEFTMLEWFGSFHDHGLLGPIGGARWVDRVEGAATTLRRLQTIPRGSSPGIPDKIGADEDGDAPGLGAYAHRTRPYAVRAADAQPGRPSFSGLELPSASPDTCCFRVRGALGWPYTYHTASLFGSLSDGSTTS